MAELCPRLFAPVQEQRPWKTAWLLQEQPFPGCETPSLRKRGQKWEFWGLHPTGSTAQQLHIRVRLAAVACGQFLFFFPRAWKSPDFPWGEGCRAPLPAGPVPPGLREEPPGDRPCPVQGPGRAGAVQGAGMGPGRGVLRYQGPTKSSWIQTDPSVPPPSIHQRGLCSCSAPHVSRAWQVSAGPPSL